MTNATMNCSAGIHTPPPRRAALPACGLLLCTLAACRPEPAESPGTSSTSRFVPSTAQAEAALQSVFEAWKAGQAPGMVPHTSPAVHVTDTFRKPEERLVDYHILGEVPTDKPRCYAVDLRFEPERIERTRFTVVGIDPLWVFRLEDVELLSHWEHNMTPPGIAPDGSKPPAADASPGSGPRSTEDAGAQDEPAGDGATEPVP